jgi:transcription initiation factor TFIID subunit 7
MSDDLIVVDDIGDLDVDSLMPPPDTPRTSSSGRPMRRTSAASRLASVAALGGPADAPPAQASTERTTRSTAKQRAQPKLKLKLSDKAAAQVAGMSFLGAYDRELDDSDEDLTFDEHFVLRLPPGDDCERLRRAVASREVGSDVWFKFKGARACVLPDSGLNRSPDSRRAIFHVGNSTYSSKLVDLPCIIEAQKTLDNKQMFKVADICQVQPASAVPFRPGLTGAQMLVVEDRIENEQALNNSKTFNLDEYIWPHGITPPLHHVRKRRFRKRANKRVRPIHGGLERALTSLLFRQSRAWSRR